MERNSSATGAKPIALNMRTLASVPKHVEVFKYRREAITPGIVHIGVGNFHRAHEALYVDRCLHLPGQADWGIVGVGLGKGEQALEKASAIASQDGLYTLTEFSPDGSVSSRVIGSLIHYIHAPEKRDEALAAMADPRTRIVSLTITEGGYNIDEATGEFLLDTPDVVHDLENPKGPSTAFGFIVESLATRREAGHGGYTVLSCDNLRSNGCVARKAILSFATARDPALADWIAANASFPNSMVDRIAPKVGSETARLVRDLTGIDDRTPVTGESFAQWVLEDKFVAGRPAFEQVGVELREDVELFEAAKGRLINATHSMLAYPALMCGFRIVHEAMRETVIRAYLESFLERDAIPLVEGPPGLSLAAYKQTIIERFSNPAIGDQLERIASNGVAKLPVFLGKTFAMLLEAGGPFERVALGLVCFERYLAGRDMAGAAILVDEPHLSDEDRSLLGSGDPLAVLRLSMFGTLGLAEDDEFVEAFRAARMRLDAEGPLAAIQHAAEA